MTIWEIAAANSVLLQTVLAGTLGGVVRWLLLRSDWKTGLIGVAIGCICSYYLSPIVQPMIGPLLGLVTDDVYQKAHFSDFTVGIGGPTIAGYIMDVIAARRKKLDADGH